MGRFEKKSSNKEDIVYGDEHIPCCVVEDIHHLLRNSLRPIASCVGMAPRRKRLVSFHQGLKRDSPTKNTKTVRKPFSILKKSKTIAKENGQNRKRFILKKPSDDSESSYDCEEPKAFFRKEVSEDSEVTYESQEIDSSSVLGSSDSESSSIRSSESSDPDSDKEDSTRSRDSKVGFFHRKFTFSPPKSNKLNDSDQARVADESIGTERNSSQPSYRDAEDEAETETLPDPTQTPSSNFETSGKSNQTFTFDESLLSNATISSPVVPKQRTQGSVGKKLMKALKKMNPKSQRSLTNQETSNEMVIHHNEDTASCVSANTSHMTLHLPSFLKGKNSKTPDWSSSINENNLISPKNSIAGNNRWGNDDKSCTMKRELLYASPKEYVTNYTRSSFVKRHQQLREKEKKKYISSNASTISNVSGSIKSGDKKINCNIRLNSGIKSARE